MKTMTLIHTAEKAHDLLTMSDDDLERWFADAGLTVEAVPHCSSAGCTTCFPNRAAGARRQAVLPQTTYAA